MNQLEILLDTLKSFGYTEVKHFQLPVLRFKQYWLSKRRDKVQNKDYLELFIGGSAIGGASAILFQFDEVGTLVDTGGFEVRFENAMGRV